MELKPTKCGICGCWYNTNPANGERSPAHDVRDARIVSMQLDVDAMRAKDARIAELEAALLEAYGYVPYGAGDGRDTRRWIRVLLGLEKHDRLLGVAE